MNTFECIHLDYCICLSILEYPQYIAYYTQHIHIIRKTIQIDIIVRTAHDQ